MKERKRAEKSWDEKQIKVKMKNHSEKKKKLKLKNEKIRKEKRETDPTPSRCVTDTLFLLGCAKNEECRVRGKGQKDKKKKKFNEKNSKEIKNSLSEKQKAIVDNGTWELHL